MKRLINILGTVVVCSVIVFFTTYWVASELIKLPPEENDNFEWYHIALLVLVVIATIYTIWRLLKFAVYQLCFTVTKAIEDAKRNKGMG